MITSKQVEAGENQLVISCRSDPLAIVTCKIQVAVIYLSNLQEKIIVVSKLNNESNNERARKEERT